MERIIGNEQRKGQREREKGTQGEESKNEKGRKQQGKKGGGFMKGGGRMLLIIAKVEVLR